MRLGCCISDEGQLAALEGAGAEFCELPVARAVMAVDGGFERLATRLGAGSVPARASNVFLPGDLKVVGRWGAPPRIDEYVETALGRMERRGIGVLVIGSGAARAVPSRSMRP